MPYTSTYSLSSATDHTSCSRTKKRRVSAQLSRLLGSRSRVSSEGAQYSRRGFSEDAGIGAARSCNNNVSKAVAWMWHMRGVGDAAVLPTKQRQVLMQNACRIDARSSRKLQPSRFKAEANMLRSAAADQLDTSSSAQQNYASHNNSPASHDTLASKHEERPASTFLYDEFELASLQEMLKTEIDKQSSQLQLGAVSHDIIPDPRTSPSSKSSPSHEIKPFSAIQKLFKRLYNTVHKSNSAINSGLSAELGARKVGNVQHVIHHHHHHYHRYNGLLDSSAHDHESQPAPTSSLHGFVRRRRANSESCSEAKRPNNIIELDLVDDSLLADAHHRPRRVLHINSVAGGGSKLASAQYYYRPHSIEIF